MSKLQLKVKITFKFTALIFRYSGTSFCAPKCYQIRFRYDIMGLH